MICLIIRCLCELCNFAIAKWKEKSDDIRKPLILEGACQTGKTWIVHEFGKNEFDDIVSIW